MQRLYGDDSFFVQFMTEDQKNSKRNSEGRGRKPRNYLTDPSDVVTTIINQEGTFLFEFAILKVILATYPQIHRRLAESMATILAFRQNLRESLPGGQDVRISHTMTRK